MSHDPVADLRAARERADAPTLSQEDLKKRERAMRGDDPDLETRVLHHTATNEERLARQWPEGK